MRGALLLALALGACAPAPRGGSAAAGPAIVSLNPCTDALVAELAEPAQVRALSAFSRDPATSSMDVALARTLPTTRGSVEEVLALRPDVVVSGSFTPPATREAFARLGIRLEEFPIAMSVAESEAQVRRMAALTGHPARGEALVARIEAALAAAAPPPATAPVQTLVWQEGRLVPGADALITELMARAGLASYSAAMGMKQADLLPLERLLADPPRLILVAGNPRAEENRALSHPALASLSATRRERFDSALLWCAGPTIVHAAARLAQVRQSR